MLSGKPFGLTVPKLLATAILCFVRPCGRTDILVAEKALFHARTFGNKYIRNKPQISQLKKYLSEKNRSDR